jgi:hypothetical protein
MTGLQQGVRRHGGMYYGWPMPFAVAVAQITSWGVLYYAFTVFLEPMRSEFG